MESSKRFKTSFAYFFPSMLMEQRNERPETSPLILPDYLGQRKYARTSSPTIRFQKQVI